MRPQAGNSAVYAGILLVFSMVPALAVAQQGTVLTGTVMSELGKPVANAHIAARSAESGQTVETTSGADGAYRLPALMPGNYTVTVSADSFANKESTITLTGAGKPTLNVTLAKGGGEQALPNAPAAAAPAQEPSLQDLGFSQQQMQGNPQLQARLDKRTEMLKIHQRLGLITVLPMAADLITGPMAKAKGKNGQTITEPSQTNLDLHAALGSTTAALYFTTAYFAVFAPKVPGVQKKGAIRMHEALAFIHGPGMILTPILGAAAFKQEQAGEKVHGIASYHGTVAYITTIAYGASIIAVSWPIHLKFWEK